MHLLQSGVDMTVIALWLGHESPSTTQIYIEAKRAILDRMDARQDDAQVGLGNGNALAISGKI